MLRYPCLVLDHDDTVVKSTRQIHYPAFCHTLSLLRQGEHISFEAFQQACAHPGFEDLCTKQYGFTEEEMKFELQDWLTFSKEIIPDCFEDFKKLLPAFRKAGGILCVVSHSDKALITRDYEYHFGCQPDYIYDLHFTPQKPHPAPLLAIMQQTGFAPEQLLTVDDLPAGQAMAAAAGVDFAYAAFGQPAPKTDELMRQSCRFVLNTPQNLASLLGLI